jgi:hypothetical protein
MMGTDITNYIQMLQPTFKYKKLVVSQAEKPTDSFLGGESPFEIFEDF